MKFISLFIFATTAVTSTLAAPTELEKRDLSAYVCEGSNFTGRCVNYRPPWNTCEPFSALGLSGYQSWGPGQGTTCLWYTGGGCTGTQSGAVNYPGYTQVPGFWEFNTASFKCWN